MTSAPPELSAEARERIDAHRDDLRDLADSELPASRHAAALLDALEEADMLEDD